MWGVAQGTRVAVLVVTFYSQTTHQGVAAAGKRVWSMQHVLTDLLWPAGCCFCCCCCCLPVAAAACCQMLLLLLTRCWVATTLVVRCVSARQTAPSPSTPSAGTGRRQGLMRASTAAGGAAAAAAGAAAVVGCCLTCRVVPAALCLRRTPVRALPVTAF
jgi:hypothetical protein